MAKMTPASADRIIKAAKLDGFAGNCGRVAIAINHSLFEGRGRYVVATNPHLSRARGVPFFGHVVVEWKGHLFDASGLIVDETDVEAWGILDPSDPDLADLITEEEAEDGQMAYIDEFGNQQEQEDAIETYTKGRCSLQDVTAALRTARR